MQSLQSDTYDSQNQFQNHHGNQMYTAPRNSQQHVHRLWASSGSMFIKSEFLFLRESLYQSPCSIRVELRTWSRYGTIHMIGQI